MGVGEIENVWGNLIKRYQQRRPNSFAFKDKVTKLLGRNSPNNYPHYIHYYPGKIFPFIPLFIFSSEKLCPHGGIVLDPFSGSGTVLLESLINPLYKRSALGVEINPLGRLISKVKTTPLESESTKETLRQIINYYEREPKNKTFPQPTFKNKDLWFSEKANERLSRLRYSIGKAETSQDIKDFFWVCFSSIVRKVSKEDPFIPPPVVLKKHSNKLSFIIGDYGMGKTMSLLKIAEDSAKHKEVFSVYMNFLGEQKPKNPGVDFIGKIFKSVDFEKIRLPKSRGVPEGMSAEMKNVYEKIIFGKGGERALALYFLRGEVNPNKSQMKELGVMRKINNIEVAKEYLIGLLQVLNSSGISILVLVIDEFEYLFSIVPKGSQNIYLAVLRGLYDLPIQRSSEKWITNMAMFLAVSDDGWRRMQDLENRETSIGGPIQPLMRRVQSKIRLKPFSKEDTEKLIEKRLSLNRTTGVVEKNPLIPFTKDFVDYVFKLSAGKPSDIIFRCDHVLDAGLESMTPKLTANFAKQVFEKRGFTY